MIELECPNCGGYGAVPKEKANTRLVCKKCHFVFHLDPAGRVRSGEPPADQGRVTAVHAASHRVALQDMEMPQIGFGLSPRAKTFLSVLGVIALVGIGYNYVSGPGQSLGDVTTYVADALAKGDAATVKKIAVAGSEDDIVKAVEELRNDLAALKKDTTTQELLVSTVVSEENRRQRFGKSTAFFAPKPGTSRDESIATQAMAIPGKKRALDVDLDWKLDSSGKWRLDGHRLLVTIAPPH